MSYSAHTVMYVWHVCRAGLSIDTNIFIKYYLSVLTRICTVLHANNLNNYIINYAILLSISFSGVPLIYFSEFTKLSFH